MSIVIRFSICFYFCFRRRQSGFHKIVSDGIISGVRRKWKRSHFSDSDSAALMTLLTTPFFDFHLVISALATSHDDSDSDSVASEN